MSDRGHVTEAIARGLRFIAAGQLPSGQFHSQMRILNAVDPLTGQPPVHPDPSPFATAHIVYSLTFVKAPEVQAMIDQAIVFFRRQEIRGGMWRYLNKDSPLARRTPPDVDDTAAISDLLAQFGGGPPDNRAILLNNRNRGGLFYTWIIPRAILSFNIRYWRLMLAEQNYERTFLYWRGSGARRNDVQPIVNANALLYFGDTPEMAPVVEYLVSTAHERREQVDKWYRDVHAFYHAVSRPYARGCVRLEALRAPMVERFSQTADSSGRIGASALQTALALCAIANFRVETPLAARALRFLLDAQSADGGWDYSPFYFDGRDTPQLEWGSREITTGFCLEALARHGASLADG